MVDVSARVPGHSLGLKLILVGLLAMLMGIPALMVFAPVWDRSERAEEVMREVGAEAGGPQTIYGPMLVVPFQEPVKILVNDTANTAPTTPGAIIAPQYRIEMQQRALVFLPDMFEANAQTDVELRKRSIFHVPVYLSAVGMRLRFEALKLPKMTEGAEIDWEKARLAFGMGDIRGIKEDIALRLAGNDATISFEPGYGEGISLPMEAGVSALVGQHIDPTKPMNFSIMLSLSGAQELHFAPVGRETKVTIESNWPHPSFEGAFLTTDHTISDTGFSANWVVPHLARNIPQASFAHDFPLYQLRNTEFGVGFVLPGNPYQRVGRALKYALMFVGFVFLGFFLFEATSPHRVHAAQYILVGAAQIVFYLLLLSLAEQWDFDRAYLAAAGGTVLLTALYAGFSVGAGRGFAALIIFSGVYGLLYLLMRMEDYALLIGSITAFIAIALTMLLTRDVNWYGDDGGAVR